MAGLLNWLGGDQAEQDPSQNQSQDSPAKVYVTQEEMMDALKKLQSRIEDRLRAERNKRAQRFQKLSEDVAKRFAEVEGNLLHEVSEQHQQLATGADKAKAGGPTPDDVERLAQAIAQREARLSAMVSARPKVPSVVPSGTSDFDDTRSITSGISRSGDTKSITSGVSRSGSRNKLLDELKAKADKLEKGSNKLSAASKSGSSDYMITNSAGVPESRSAGNLSIASGQSEPTGFADRVLSWTTKLDYFESNMQTFSRRLSTVEVKVKAFEEQLEGRVQASIKKEIKILGLDRGR